MTTVDAVCRYLAVEGPSAASVIGAAVWAGRKRGRVVSSNGGGDYGAQMLLGRMRKAGLVRHAPSEGATLWELTPAGHARAEEDDWRVAPCIKCGCSLMRWWRFCPGCGSALPSAGPGLARLERRKQP